MTPTINAMAKVTAMTITATNVSISYFHQAKYRSTPIRPIRKKESVEPISFINLKVVANP